jgi:hypothetical protein
MTTTSSPIPETRHHIDSGPYAKCIEASKRVRWDIDRDVLRGRTLDFAKRFLPEGLARISGLEFLSPAERLLLDHVQGRTYSNMFGLVERFIAAKILQLGRDHALGDQTALEALVRFADEELKHQELFRRLEQMTALGMPPGYTFAPDPNEVARAVLGTSTWAVLALTCHIELFTQVHYRESIEADPDLSELYRDVYLFHWKEESQHALLDILEWRREDARLTAAERDRAVDELIGLVQAVDGILVGQAASDARYFVAAAGRSFAPGQVARLDAALLAAYRWQYIVSGLREPRFAEVLTGLVTPDQAKRIGEALRPLLEMEVASAA